MPLKRVIPVLTLVDNSIVKTISFKSPQYIGDPLNIARIFNSKCVDELILLNISKDRFLVDIDYELISDICGECFMPISYGGGIRDMNQVEALFSLGVEKVIVQNLIFTNPELLIDIVKRFGSQSLVLSIDIYKSFFGGYFVYDSLNNAKLFPFKFSWLGNLIDKIKPGELMIQMVKNEGKLKGIDENFLLSLSSKYDIPLIFSGGVSSTSNIDLILNSGIDACAVGSYFIFQGPHRSVLISYYDSPCRTQVNFL